MELKPTEINENISIYLKLNFESVLSYSYNLYHNKNAMCL